MFKVVDPVERREQIAEGVWRVIRRDGLASASVRNVAAEAGLSQGSLRHFFGSQSELLVFSLRLAGERTRARMQAAAETAGGGRDLVEAVVEAMVPVDHDRRIETEVWLAFLGAALSDPALRALNDEIFDGMRQMFADVLDELVESGHARPGIDLSYEADRLYAIVDGLALHAIVRPEVVTPERLRSTLTRHLDELCR
ncbi:TetR/AcrR family transcriptional regulator [Pseudonocardia sp. TRM90224]|uniref:TetR/AcrR family transcriptional regulator n=1 Tax=Pseudonocardia sp. TRM90224 TaxID=2812678 RepID=UPI001E38BA83|nr:TetR/AcrR family transcriptional regulator [Pseudonocardia sp. TRM90224]